MKMKLPRGAEAKGKMDLPFGSVLTGPALVTAVLFVAGFSYEWAFYYNFGLEHIARQLPTLSTAIAAFEVVRDASDALYAAALLILPQILLGAVSFLLVYSAAYAGSWAGTHAYRTLAIEADNRLPRVTLFFYKQRDAHHLRAA